MDLLIDLLFPRTDTVVFVELVVVAPRLLLFVWWSWGRGQDLRLLSIGVLVFTLAFMAARTLH